MNIWIKKILKWLGTAGLLLLMTAGAVFAILQTTFGRNLAMNWIGAAVSGPGGSAAFGTVQGVFPFDVRIDHLALADKEGDWFFLDGFVFRVSAPQLLLGRLHIREIQAREARLERLPQTGEVETKDRPAVSWHVPSLPEVRVERLRLDDFFVGAPILGRAMAFSMDGRLESHAEDRSIQGVFQVKRVDGPVGEANLSWTVSGEPALLSLDLTASEEEGGVLASALDLAGGGTLRFTLKGTSPLADWTGDLLADVSNLGTLECQVGWVLDEGVRVRADGVMRPNGIYLARPPWVLLGKEARFGAEVEFGSGGALTIRRAAVTGEDASFDFSGRIEDETGDLSGVFHLALARLDLLAESGMDLAGSVRGEGKVTGTFERPKISLDLEAAKGVKAAGVSVHEMVLHLTGQVNGEASHEPRTWRLKGDGRVQGFRVSDGPDLPDGGPVVLSFEAAGLPGGMIEVMGFQLANRDLKLGLRGEVKLRPGPIPSFSGKMEGEVHDLSRYTSLLGVELGGKTQFSADVAVKGVSPEVSAAIKGTIQGFTSTLSLVNAVAEKTVHYGGEVTISEEGSRIAITGLGIDSERMRIQGEGRVDLTEGQTSGRFKVAIPELAFLSKPVGAPLNGSLASTIQIQGPLSAPSVAADITVEPIGVTGLEFEKVAATIQTDPIGRDWSGDLTMEAVHEGRTLKLQSRYAMNEDRLSLTDLSLNGAGVEVAGQVRLDLENPVLEGHMSGTIEAAGLLSDVLRQRIETKAHLEVSAGAGQKGQDLRFKVSAPEVVTSYGKAKGLEGTGRLHDLFGHPAGEGTVNLKAFETEGVHVKGLALNAEGDLGAVRFDGSAGGQLGEEPFDLKARGKIVLPVVGAVLEMNLFEGTVAGHEVALAGPARVSFAEQGFVLEKTEIRLDKSSLSAEGRVGHGGVALDSRFEGIPLELIRVGVSGFPEVAGTASGTVRITGRTEAPAVAADLEIKGLRPAGKSFDHLPDASIRASVQVKDGVFSSRAVMEGVSERPIAASLKAPVVLTFSPPDFSFLEAGPMEGQLDAEVRVETLASYFPSEDHLARGDLKTALSLSGRPSSPNLKGSLELRGGAYDNLQLGLLLRDVALQLAMTNDRVEITTLRATDGENGRFEGKGQATFGGNQPLDFELRGQMKGFKAVRQDTLTVTATGRLDVKGSTEAMEVSGDFVLDPVEIRIPDQFPPEVVPLDVIEVHGSESGMSTQETKPEQTGAFPVALDLKLKMPERLFLRGRGLDSEWGGGLQIKGPAQRPAITGDLSVVRGTANVLGKIFQLTSGSVAFDGSFPPSPQMEMVAEKKGVDMTARVRASGSPAAFTLKLESDPPLPEDEILSRLLFGKSTSQISPFQALTLAQSVSELSGQKSIGIFDRTRRMLGLDQIGVTQSDNAEEGTAVSVGKYVSDNVYLQAQKSVTGEGGKVGVAVDVTRNIKLDTEAGADAAQVGVIWQWDY